MSQETSRPAPAYAPIDTLDTSAAKLYTHLHPILVLSLYAYKFQAIVADPVPALTNTLLWLAGLQVAYVAICLPPTGSGSGEKKKVEKKLGEKKKKAGPGALETGLSKISPAFIALLAAPLAIPIIFATLVLFGAPVTTLRTHTLLCAAHISLLTTMPLVYVHGIVGQTAREVISFLRPIDEVQGAMVGTLVGAWLGAVPIPLDWDREWQKWPVTIVTGAYLGFVVGKILGGTLLKGKRISFDA